MELDTIQHRRRSIRLQDFDYSSPGAYFITICTAGRLCLFGQVVKGEMQLSKVGEMIQASWAALPKYYPNVEADALVIMPNHIHGIICVKPGRAQRPAPTLSLPDVVQRFKSLTTTRYRKMGASVGKLWQRNYYEHVIRNEDELASIRYYINTNPLRWAIDRENPALAEKAWGGHGGPPLRL